MTTERPLTGRLPSICLNAYDSVTSNSAPIPTPPPTPPQILSTAVSNISGYGYASRPPGRPPPHLIVEDDVRYIYVTLQDSTPDVIGICASGSVALRIDAFEDQNYDPILKGRRIRLTGVTAEQTINPDTNEATRKHCKATSINFLEPVD